MAVDEGSYEDCRRKRLEENKKRMEELKLTQLSHKLRNASRKPSPSGKPQKEMIPVEVRRSSRVKETIVYFQRPRSYKQRDLLKATEVQSNLDPKFPSFVKHMLQSYVTGYKLALPLQFCKKNLPLSDDIITLVDEDGDEYQTVYLSKNRPGLSGGWRGFSLAHDLVDGDALVFQLIETTTFKVYIVRANDSK
ncbi:hypothetical protein MRB53_033679 [Persea americana]|uniref:Uncharacterized protein n=1 Tax=Persea americana TaxID=3435 RepID=A0ACC2KV87_PERAE|nr:hypothetical protein MRB53_033679 [Persea americana]